jgi:ADP-ribose pyrophosphatase YjhB (NUDIX family)
MPQTESQNQFVGCIIYKPGKDTEVLLVQPLGRGKRKWAIPEVEVGSDEDMAEAVRNEVADETGVRAPEVDYLGFVDYPRGRLHCYFGKAPKTAQPKRGHLEVRDVKFIALAEAMSLVDKRQQKLLNALLSSLAFLQETA